MLRSKYYNDTSTLIGELDDQWILKNVFNLINPDVLKNLHIVVWDWRYRDDKTIHEYFPWDEWEIARHMHPNIRTILIIDSLWEAPNYGFHIQPLVHQLVERNHLTRSDVIHLTSNGKVVDEIAQLNCDWAFACGNHNYDPNMNLLSDTTWDHHFVMLSRIARPLRLLASTAVLRKGLEPFGYISCGAAGGDDTLDRINEWVPADLRHRFPLLIDGYVGQGDIKQYDITDARMMNAAFNVICETSQDESLGGNNTAWSDAFITEKTVKSFKLGQLPIWIAVPGTVQLVRDHGYDVFDDIIDHGYDNEQDPHVRIDRAINQLQRFCGMSIDNLRKLRTDILPRLQKNRDMVISKINGIFPEIACKLENCLRSLHPTQ